MKTGSIRAEPYAMWLADRHTGTSRFVHWSAFGVTARYGMRYGPAGRTLHVAFVARDAVLHDPLAVVGVHVVGAEADRVVGARRAWMQSCSVMT
jgi:hypothetical protein